MNTPIKKNLKETKSNGNGNRTLGVRNDKVAVEYPGHSDLPRPVHLNSETADQREKRLAKRKILTLKVFRSAYENHHQRKVS